MTISIVENKQTAAKLIVLTLLMFSFGYLMVPLYEKFCEATGIRNLLNPADDISDLITDSPRDIRTEFITTSQGLVSMRPNMSLANLKTGQTYSVIYTLKNLSSKPLVGQAIPSFSPARGGRWFKKIQCFCFEQLKMQPNETISAPVVFIIDSTIDKEIKTLSLAYTFFEIEGASF